MISLKKFHDLYRNNTKLDTFSKKEDETFQINIMYILESKWFWGNTHLLEKLADNSNWLTETKQIQAALPNNRIKILTIKIVYEINADYCFFQPYKRKTFVHIAAGPGLNGH